MSSLSSSSEFLDTLSSLSTDSFDDSSLDNIHNIIRTMLNEPPNQCFSTISHQDEPLSSLFAQPSTPSTPPLTDLVDIYRMKLFSVLVEKHTLNAQYQAQFATLNQEINAKDIKISALSKIISDTQQHLEAIISENQALILRNKDLESNFEKISAHEAKISAENSILQSKIENLQGIIHHSVLDFGQSQSNLIDHIMSTINDTFPSRIQSIVDNIAHLRQSFQNQSKLLIDSQDQITLLSNQICETENTLNNFSIENSNLKTKLSISSSELLEYESLIENLNEKIQKLNFELNTTKQLFIEEEQENKETMKIFTSKISKLTRDRAELISYIEILENQINRLKSSYPT
ncbi:hypothetical protein RCL1_002818 [Eukaryota sp. TZLM3-RCL]